MVVTREVCHSLSLIRPQTVVGSVTPITIGMKGAQAGVGSSTLVGCALGATLLGTTGLREKMESTWLHGRSEVVILMLQCQKFLSSKRLETHRPWW